MKTLIRLILLSLTVGFALARASPTAAHTSDLYPFSHLLIDQEAYESTSINDRVWHETGTSITIRVIPPRRQTTWFRSTAVELSAAALLFAYHLKTYHFRKKNRRLEDMVARRTAQLEEINHNLQAEVSARRQVEDELRASEARFREQKRAETSLQQARDQLITLLVVSQNLVSTLHLDPLLNLVLDQLSTVIRYDAAVVLGINHDRIEPLVYRGPTIPEDLAYLRFHFADNPILQQLSRSQKYFYIKDAQAPEALVGRFGGSLGEWGKGLALYRSWLALPLIVKGELIGSLVLAHTQPSRFDPTERYLAKAFANQAAIAMENARLYREAQEAAVTTERIRLARDLHDSITQALYAINMFSEASRLALTAEKIDVAFQNLDELQSMVQEAMTDLRVLIYELRPPVLEAVGLAAALKHRLDAVEARAGIQTDLLVEGDCMLPPEVETELFRAAQEALTNALKHAKATSVQVHLRFTDDLVRLSIRDNGLGFRLQDQEAGNGMGLHNLSERVQRIGGTMTLETSPGAGTALNIELRNLG